MVCMTKPFTVEDLYLHRKVTELGGAPDGASIACTVRSVDRDQDDYVSCIWSVPVDGTAPTQLTRGPGLDSAPRWAPDGSRLAFLSTRGGGPAQVHLLPKDGGEAAPLGKLPGAVSELRWFPDGRALVVSAAVTVDPDWRGERPNGREPKERKVQPEVAWKLPYKSDGMGFMLAREVHLFHLDAQTGEHTQLTDGPFDVLSVSVAPDGRHLAYSRTRSGRFSHRTDLWVCDADGSGARQLTREFATVMSPTWSPDGRHIAFSATVEEGDAQTNLYVLDSAGGKARRLGDADLQVADPESVHWTADGQGLLFARQERGRHQIVRIGLDGQLEVRVQGHRQFGAFAPSGQTLAYTVEHPSHPSEVHVCPADGGERQASDFNPWWKDRTPILAETWEFQVPDGRGGTEKIEGWLMRAEGSTGPLPLLNDVHGGPASYALLDFDTNVYWHALCSQGWAILALNAVGSASYGREFCDRLMGHWGEYDLPQHLAAVQQLRDEGVCDERMAIAGKSYGGYLSGWAIGKTNEFRAAVVMAPVGNIETHYGTSDGGYYADPYYMGTKERFDRPLAKQLSPMNRVERATTPTLFMQGADDERCPKCQSEELFVSLMRAGDTPAELVLYPGEDHHFLGEGTPSVRQDAAQRIIDWIAKHIERTPAPLPEAETASQDAHG